jgi:hypothetical protein
MLCITSCFFLPLSSLPVEIGPTDTAIILADELAALGWWVTEPWPARGFPSMFDVAAGTALLVELVRSEEDVDRGLLRRLALAVVAMNFAF